MTNVLFLKPTFPKNEIKVFNWVETGLGVPFQTMLLTGLNVEWVLMTPAEAKVALDAMPEGKRAIFWWHGCDSLYTQDFVTGSDGVQYRSIYPDNGIAHWKGIADTWFGELKALGGKVDYVYFDYEDGISIWNGVPGNPAHAQALMDDHRWGEIASKLGFSDLINPPVWDFRGNQNYTYWGALTSALRDRHMNEAIHDPIKKYFPDVKQWCDASTVIKRSNACRDFNGHIGWSWWGQDESAPDGGTGYATHDVIYQFNGPGPSFTQRTDVTGDGLPVGDSAYKAMLFLLEGPRAQMRSSARPWVVLMAYEHFSWGGDLTQSNVHGTPYYKEVVFHALLTGADTIEYWNPSSGAAGLFPADPVDPLWVADNQKLHSVVVEAQAHIPYKGTCLTKERVNYRSDQFVTSFKMVNGQTVSRVTYASPVNGSFGHWELI